MKTNRTTQPTSLALGSLTAAVALLAGISGASAQSQVLAPVPPSSYVGAGSFPQSFIVPGTSTSLAIGGVIELDVGEHIQGSGAGTSTAAYDFFSPFSTGVHGGGGFAGAAGLYDHGNFRMNPNFSRIHFETRTPTDYGELKTYFEFNAYAVSQPNGTNVTATTGGSFNLQAPFLIGTPLGMSQAYGTLGPWLFGMTFSLANDFTAWADMIDGGSEAGGQMYGANVFVPQIRYTYLLPNGLSIAASLETVETGGIIGSVPGAGGFVGTAATLNNWTGPGYSLHIPALIVAPRIDQPWGHVKFAAVGMQQRLQNLNITTTPVGGGPITTPFGPTSAFPPGAHVSQWGYDLALTGHLNTIGLDKLTWQATAAQGASNYDGALSAPEDGTSWEEGLVCNQNTTASLACSQAREMGLNMGYVHYWTNEWRSAVSFGYDHESLPSTAGGWGRAPVTGAGAPPALSNLEHSHMSSGANVHWQPLTFVQFGLEYDFYKRTVWSGAHGTANLVRGQVDLLF